MQTVDKAMSVLGVFSTLSPEVGLTEVARRAGLDKAAARRLLVALQKHDFIEQDTHSRRYRLGAGFLHLARIREASFPVKKIVSVAVARLADATTETSHGSLFTNDTLATIAISEGVRSTRVHIDAREELPLHATASGLCYLAYSSPEHRHLMLGRPLSAFTQRTTTQLKQLQAQLEKTRREGIGMADQTYEDEVVGMAAPFFDADCRPMGAIAVATPSSRVTDTLTARIRSLLFQAAIEVTHGIGGQLAPDFADSHRRLLNDDNAPQHEKTP